MLVDIELNFPEGRKYLELVAEEIEKVAKERGAKEGDKRVETEVAIEAGKRVAERENLSVFATECVATALVIRYGFEPLEEVRIASDEELQLVRDWATDIMITVNLRRYLD